MIRDAANFLRKLLTGRDSSVEEWRAWEYLLLHGVVKAKRWSDYRDRTFEVMDNIKAWLRMQREYFLSLSDEQLVDATQKHFHYWVKYQPYPVAISYECQMAHGRMETFPDRSEAKEDLEDIEAPDRPQRGRPRKPR